MPTLGGLGSERGWSKQVCRSALRWEERDDATPDQRLSVCHWIRSAGNLGHGPNVLVGHGSS